MYISKRRIFVSTFGITQKKLYNTVNKEKIDWGESRPTWKHGEFATG